MESIMSQAVHLGPAAQEVLAIEELLHRVFLVADMPTKASCARVCRSWFESSIRELWGEILLVNAVKLLAPVSWDDASESWTFSRVLNPEDWKRFHIYAAHVRWIDSGYCAEHTSSVVAAMALSRPVYNIFPTLKNIAWSAPEVFSLAESVVFMSPTVRHLDFAVADIGDNSQNFDAFCLEIQSRLPHLTWLSIRTNLPVSEFGGAITGLVKNLHHLERCHLPKYWITTEIFLALSRLPKIREVYSITVMGRPPTVTHISDAETIDFHNLAEGAFDSLTWLRLTANFRDIHNLIEHVHGPRFLTRLVCDALHNEAPHEIFDFVTSVAIACPRLEILNLTSYVSAELDPEVTPAWDWNLLRPILQCRSLMELVIGHSLPLSITEEDLVELARDRTTWKCIVLTPFPAFQFSPRPTLAPSALLPFARHCPKITELGLFIDGDLQLPETRAEPQFSLLTQLTLGHSLISEQNIGAFGWFLAGLCVRPVRIGSMWAMSPVRTALNLELDKRASRWKRVEELQNGVCTSQWFTSLREENVVLRKQVDELEGQLRALTRVE